MSEHNEHSQNKDNNPRYTCLRGVELLESRQMLSVSPLTVGAVYVEGAYNESGDGYDLSPDYIYVSFTGGAENTQLTQLTINMDKDSDGPSVLDAYIDLGEYAESGQESGPGVYGSFPFKIVNSDDLGNVSYSISDDGALLVMTFSDFNVGETLILELDVDSYGRDKGTSVVEGEEFADTKFSAVFSAPHYNAASVEEALFKDNFETFYPGFDGKISSLPTDDFQNIQPTPDGLDPYTAGAFAEVVQTPLPATISGKVFEDADYSKSYTSGDKLMVGVSIQLWKLNENSNSYSLYDSTVTDANGEYTFNVEPGTYQVMEGVTAGYVDVASFPGSINGVEVGSVLDVNSLTDINILGGQDSIHNDFAEVKYAQVSGKVWVDDNQNDLWDSNETLLENVQIDLNDSNGNFITSTYTDKNGYYEFTELYPGIYQVYEHQPAGYYNGGQKIGTHKGEDGGIDLMVGITLLSGDVAENYDFWEYNYAKISGYVFQDGDTLTLGENDSLPTNLWDIYTGERDTSSTPISGVLLYLGDASGMPILDADGKEITATTDKNGYYEFTNLKPGTYTVLEKQPEDYTDGLDTQGSLGGTPVNPNKEVEPDILSTLAVDPNNDAILKINVKSGNNGVEYNFSEIKVERTPSDPETPPPGGTPEKLTPPGYANLSGGAPSPLAGVGYIPQASIGRGTAMGGGAGGTSSMTWHLSVLNAGQARGVATENLVHSGLWKTDIFDPETWTSAEDMRRILWLMNQNDGGAMSILFGLDGAKPLTGDFNGDGADELAVYLDGFWFIDLNGNEKWDEGDLWAQLGHPGDQPIVGDWDGDGKSDIGTFGPLWKGDELIAERELGLPDADNRLVGKYKNLRSHQKNEVAYCTSKRTAQGPMRRDLIDHIFQFGQDTDIAVTGDWNGDGVTNIGLFRDGHWILDMDGDGRFTENDRDLTFGEKGDLPVVGDWNHDGIAEVGVYRKGQWILDESGRGVMDSSNLVFNQGSPSERPIVGDFSGDGRPQFATYKPVTEASPAEISRANEAAVKE